MAPEIIRANQKRTIPEIEAIIVDEVVRLQAVKGESLGKITYDLIEEAPRAGSRLSAASYDSDNDILYVPRDPSKPELAYHELIHKFQQEHRRRHGYDPSGLPEGINRVLIEGDAYRLMIDRMLESRGKRPGSLSSRFSKRVAPYSFYVSSFVLSALGAVGNIISRGRILEDNEMYEKGRELRDASKGMKYMQQLHELSGETLVNFAYIHDHGSQLTGPKKLLQIFQGGNKK